MDIGKITGDVNLKAEGVWLRFGEDEVKLAYLMNQNYQHYIGQRMLKARNGQRNIPADRSESMVNEALAKFVIKGWRGFTKDGKPYDFTPDNVTWLLENSPNFRSWVIEKSANIENFGGVDPDAPEEEDGPEGELKSGPSVASGVGTAVRVPA